MKYTPTLCALALLAAGLLLGAPNARAQGTSFTYQGRLDDGGFPANGIYDLEFRVFDAVAGGTQQGGIVSTNDVVVSNGLFMATVDFGSGTFNGPARWLQIAVRPGASVGAYTNVAPRQPLTPAPYATFAGGVSAAGISGNIPASQLSGTLNEAQVPASIPRLTVTNTAQQAFGVAINASPFPGPILVTQMQSPGSGYTTPPAVTVNSPVGSGAVINAVVNNGAVVGFVIVSGGSGYPPGNLPLTISPPPPSQYQIFQGANAFSGGVILTNPANVVNGTFTGNGTGAFTGTFTGNGTGTFNGTGNGTFTGTFNGNGAGLTDLNAVNLVGTIPGARLPADVASRNFGNDFYGPQRFFGQHTIIDGYVGIGTNAPAAPLHVASASFPSALVDGSSIYGTWTVLRNSAGGTNWQIINTGSSNGAGKLLFAAGPAPNAAAVIPLTLQPDGRVGIGTSTPATTLDIAGEATMTACNITSDRNAKEQFKPVNPREVLDKVVRLAISEWQYKTQSDARHIGPMAQDFRAAFALGRDDKHITSVDADGVALAAIQGLNEKLEEKSHEVEALKKSVAELSDLVKRLASPGQAAGR